jgi:CRISPR/Cas system CSM-associated protein Csm5 (group 7 of RAMP superfamily)
MAVKHFELTFETAGYVHIGCGNNLNKKDYFIANNSVHILDAAKFTGMLNEDQLARYVEFLLENDKSSLDDFLGNNKDIQQLAQKAVRYKLDTQLNRNKSNQELAHGIAEFVKDANGAPYIPGSSVKGTLRNAIVMHQILRNQKPFQAKFNDNKEVLRGTNKKEKARTSKNVLQNACKLEPGADSKKRDIMRFISVADSDPLAVKDLCLAKKYDQFSIGDGAEHKRVKNNRGGKPGNTVFKGNELNIYRECLRPGTKFTIRIDVDEQIAPYLGLTNFDATTLSDLLTQANNHYKANFLNHFDVAEGVTGQNSASDGRCAFIIKEGTFAGTRCRNNAIEGSDYCGKHQNAAEESTSATSSTVCYLGGGVGYQTKTVTAAIFDNQYDSVNEISRILYAQSPSRLVRGKHADLATDIEDAGFQPKYEGGKEDHRHWKSGELGVAPHTLKLGCCGNDKREMGKCTISIREIQ